MDAGMVNIASSYFANDHHGTVQGGGSGNGYLKPPYDGSDSVTYAAMNCTDCHGAHGSPNIFNLKAQITIGGTVMTVGGWAGDGVGEVIGDGPPGAEQTVYYLPRMDGRNTNDASGVQEDHQWGAWCSFCHQMQSHGRDETVTCTAGHMHGDGKM
jgi:cytochrome c553